MKKFISKLLVVAILLGFFGMTFSYAVFADEENAPIIAGTSISLEPTSKILQIASGSIYDESFTVNNDGDSELKVEVYAAPYSYVYSDEEDLYKLGFNNENNYTQLSRWISFEDSSGNYVEKPIFLIAPHDSLKVKFRISTPASIPGGGQYAVIFAHTLSSPSSSGGIRTEASPGIVVYGRSLEGEANVSSEIIDLTIDQKSVDGKSGIVASAKVKNTGNIDFNASGILKVEPIIGFDSYETPSNISRTSIIPDAEIVISDNWADAPSFGIYKATWTVSVGENTEFIETIIFRISPFIIIITIIVLTFIIVSVIMALRKRKERRSRLAI